MKPTDRLAIIKQTQRALRAEARLIRQQILSGAVSLEGDDHIASIQHHVRLYPVIDRPSSNGVEHAPRWTDARV